MGPKPIQSESRIAWPESLIQGWAVGLNNCLQRTLYASCQVKSTRLLFIHSFFSTHIQVSEVLDPVLNNIDIIPRFYEAQRTAEESEGRES